ncbi:MAG: hypothetical protein U0Q08_06300 [Dermatophilaceae bacterium]
MTKLAVTGPGAGPLLDFVSTAHVDGEPGRITYTQWLSDTGAVEADLADVVGGEEFVVDILQDPLLARIIAWPASARTIAWRDELR